MNEIRNMEPRTLNFEPRTAALAELRRRVAVTAHNPHEPWRSRCKWMDFPRVGGFFHRFSHGFHLFFRRKARHFRGLHKNRLFFYFARSRKFDCATANKGRYYKGKKGGEALDIGVLRRRGKARRQHSTVHLRRDAEMDPRDAGATKKACGRCAMAALLARIAGW